MLCFRISLNGRHLTTAGISGFGVVSTTLLWTRFEADAPRGTPNAGLSVGGSEGDYFLEWHDGVVRPGDVVTIEVKEAAVADAPLRHSARAYDFRGGGPVFRRVLQRLAEVRGRLRRLGAE